MQMFNFAVENCHQVAKLLFGDHPIAKQISPSYMHALALMRAALYL